jgi:uncharacterized protein (DUF1501 family)
MQNFNRQQLFGNIEPSVSVKTAKSSGVLPVLIGVFVFSGLTLIALKHLPTRIVAAPAVAASPAVKQSGAVPISQAEDLRRHLEAALADAMKAAEETRRSQTWMSRVAPALQRNYLGLEKTRLKAAETASQSAQRYIELLREEVEIISGILGGKENHEPENHRN